MRLDEQAWPDVRDDRPVLCVPIGSCEQHGPHLPLGTDTMIAEALAAGLTARRPSVQVAPALTVSASGEHDGFAGTLSIGTEVTTAVLVELARSAAWADGLVLVNGHGGNRDAVERAIATMRDEGRRALAWAPAAAGGDAHAGRTETSILLALRPDLVHLDRVAPGGTAPIGQLMGRLRSGGVRAVAPSGVLGDPTGASATEGRELLAALVDDLVGAVDAWLTWAQR